MANGLNAAQNGLRGRDTWSKRPYSMWPLACKRGNKDVKRLTHKAERQEAKKQIDEILHRNKQTSTG